MADWQPPKLSVMDLRECQINYFLIEHQESITCLALNLTALKWHGEAVRDVAVKRAATILAWLRPLTCEVEPFNHGHS